MQPITQLSTNSPVQRTLTLLTLVLSASSALFAQVQRLHSTSPAKFDPSSKNQKLLLILVFHILYFLETN